MNEQIQHIVQSLYLGLHLLAALIPIDPPNLVNDMVQQIQIMEQENEQYIIQGVIIKLQMHESEYFRVQIITQKIIDQLIQYQPAIPAGPALSSNAIDVN